MSCDLSPYLSISAWCKQIFRGKKGYTQRGLTRDWSATIPLHTFTHVSSAYLNGAQQGLTFSLGNQDPHLGIAFYLTYHWGLILWLNLDSAHFRSSSHRLIAFSSSWHFSLTLSCSSCCVATQKYYTLFILQTNVYNDHFPMCLKLINLNKIQRNSMNIVNETSYSFENK